MDFLLLGIYKSENGFVEVKEPCSQFDSRIDGAYFPRSTRKKKHKEKKRVRSTHEWTIGDDWILSLFPSFSFQRSEGGENYSIRVVPKVEQLHYIYKNSRK